MKIQKRIQIAFGESKKEKILLFAEIIRENLFSLKRNIKNVMFLLFSIAVFYILTMNSQKTELLLPFFKFEDVSPLCKVVPLVMSFFYYELMILFSSRKILLKSHSTLLKEYNKSISENSLNEIFAPISTFSMTLFFSPNWEKITYSVGGVIGLNFILLPIIFIIYAYIRNFNYFGSDLLLNILLPFTVFFTVTAISIVVKTNKVL